MIDPRIENLARDVLILSRNLLLVNLRFLDVAIHQLNLRAMNEIPTMAVDGENLYYNPYYILNRYKAKRENVVRDILHAICHCLFHHPFVNKLIHQGCWDLACDIAVENAINDLGLSAVTNQRGASQLKLLKSLENDLKLITAEKLYRYYLDQNLDDEDLIRLRQDFYADDHSMWYQPLGEKSSGQAKEKAGGEKSVSQMSCITESLNTEQSI